MKGHDDKPLQSLQQKAMQLLRTDGAKTWGGFGIFCFVIFWVFSSGDFSFMLTLSSLISMFSFMMIALKIETGKSAKGLSLKMMECYILVTAFRLFAIVPWEGYLPFDKTGDWVYQLAEAVCLCLAGTTVFFCRSRYAQTYDKTTDTLNHLWLIAPSAALALIFHPNLNGFLPSDMSWAFALYLESVTVLPQLFMFMREGQAAAFTSHFLAAQAAAKLISFIFWASSFSELANKDHHIKMYVGHWVVVMQLIQLLVMGDFIYHYVRCIRKGIPVSQILCSDNV